MKITLESTTTTCAADLGQLPWNRGQPPQLWTPTPGQPVNEPDLRGYGVALSLVTLAVTLIVSWLLGLLPLSGV